MFSGVLRTTVVSCKCAKCREGDFTLVVSGPPNHAFFRILLDTVLGWGRRRFREHWATLHGRTIRGRPPIIAEIPVLVTRMAAANPL